MAACDYRSCDKCGGKTFYDANLNYEQPDESNRAHLEVGEPQRWSSLHGLGDWAVLCVSCSLLWKTAIVERVAADATTGSKGEK